MAADPRQVYRICQYRGVALRVVDGRLVARHRDGPMPADMRQFVRHFRDLLIPVVEEEARRAARAEGVLVCASCARPRSGDDRPCPACGATDRMLVIPSETSTGEYLFSAPGGKRWTA